MNFSLTVLLFNGVFVRLSVAIPVSGPFSLVYEFIEFVFLANQSFNV